MRLSSGRPWAPNDSLGLELRTSPLEPVDDTTAARAGVVPVPVLEQTGHSLTGWVDLVTGRASEGVEMSGVRARDWKRRPDAARAVPWVDDVPDPASAVPPWERVSEFRAAASPTAFALATRLAAVSTLPVMSALTASVPGAGPAHLTELLMSGLVRPAGADAERAADVVFTFGPNIRQELLALARRRDTIRVLHDVRVLMAVPEGSEPLLPAADELVETTGLSPVTPRNVAFLRIELAALRALSGRFLPQAERLARALRAYDRQNTVNLGKDTRTHTRHQDPATRVHRDAAHAPRGPETTSEGATTMATTQQPAVERARSTQPRIWGNIPPRDPELHRPRGPSGTTAGAPSGRHDHRAARGHPWHGRCRQDPDGDRVRLPAPVRVRRRLVHRRAPRPDRPVPGGTRPAARPRHQPRGQHRRSRGA